MNRKRLLSLALSATILLSMLFSLPVSAATANVQGDFTYEILQDDTAVITAYKGQSETVDIPETVDGHSVSQIGTKAFEYNKIINSVVLPNTVKEIGVNAFNDCTKLKSVVIPESVEKIDDGAFSVVQDLKKQIFRKM